MATVAAFVEVVDDGAPAVAGFGEFVVAGGAVDEYVGGIAGSFKRK